MNDVDKIIKDNIRMRFALEMLQKEMCKPENRGQHSLLQMCRLLDHWIHHVIEPVLNSYQEIIK